MKHHPGLQTILFTIFLSLFAASNTSAHPGGHYHRGDGTVLNTWQLKDGAILKGNFSMGQGDILVLEQEEGRLVRIAVTDLSEADQKLARFKITRYERLNNQSGAKDSVIYKTRLNASYMILSLLLLAAIIFITRKLIVICKTHSPLNMKLASFTGSVVIMLLSFYACKKSSENIVIAVPIPKTSPGFIDSAFAAYKPAVSTRWDENYFYVADNGIPSHNMMVGITSWQQQVPALQNYTGSNSWSIPLQPVYADIPLSTKTNFMKGAVAIAINGIPIFNALNNRGDDAYLFGELDNWGGHCGRADDYHYHIAPLHLATGTGISPIAFALDGFPVYGAKEPDGSVMQPLDTCHGHTAVSGRYHYHGTNVYPYVIGAMKGKVTIDPATPAPENQILPQAFASAFRPAGTPLNGASITAFTATGPTGYLLTYKRGSKFGTVNYSWDAANKYTFVFTDTAGVVTTAVYQR